MFKIGLDIGYGHTKIATEDGKRIIFPSLAKKGEKLNLDNILGATDDYIATINNTVWYIGKMAQKESMFATRAFDQRDRYNDEAFQAMLATALTIGSKDTDQDILLVTGLPLSIYENSQQDFQKFLKGYSAFVSINELNKEIQVKESVVFPQAGGIFFSPECLNLKDSLTDNCDVTVIDIGYRTTDVASFSFNKGSFQFNIEKSFTIDTGMSTAYKSLARTISKKLGVIDVSLEEAESVFRTGKCYKENTLLDVNKDIQLLQQIITHNIYESFRTNIIQGTRINNIILAGGGSIALKPELLKVFPEALHVSDTQIANALGFLNIAQRFDL